MSHLHTIPGVLLALASVTSLVAAEKCGLNNTQNLGSNYQLQQLQWNWGNAGPNPWQCIVYQSDNSNSVGWGAKWNVGSWNWYSVKSYPAIIRGWNWGNWIGDDKLRYYQVPSTGSKATLSWWSRWDWKSSWRGNQALDIWCHNISNPSYGNYGGNNKPTHEIMVWYNWNDVSPLGSKIGDVNVSGINFEKWQGTHPDGWQTVTYRFKTQTSGRDNLDLNPILRNAGCSGKWMTYVGAGWETFTGSAQATTTWFAINNL